MPLTFCLLALTGCIRTDIGNSIGSIGRQVAKPLPERVLPEGHPDVSDTSPCDCIVKLYRKDGRLYIEMPLVYVTERRCGFEYFRFDGVEMRFDATENIILFKLSLQRRKPINDRFHNPACRFLKNL